MCRENANQANFAAIMQINPSGGGPYTLSIEDCYAAVGTKQAYTVASGATFHNLSVVNDGKTVLSVAAGTDISTKKAELNATANYIASGDTVNIEAQALADKLGSCWVATDKTVAYGSGKTVNAVMPQPIVHLLDKTFEDIVGAEYLQFGTTESGYDVRFVGTVDIEDLSKYSAVGFDIEVRVRGGNVIKSGTLTTDKVFTSIKAAGVDCSAESLNTNYLNVLQITGFKNENIYDIKLTAFAVDAGGDVIYDYSGVVEISVQNGAIIK